MASLHGLSTSQQEGERPNILEAAQRFQPPQNGFIIYLPENVLPSGVNKVYVKVSSSGQFELPPVTECVSNIYWIHNDFTKPIHNEHSDNKFVKPVTVEIEHWTAKLNTQQHPSS